MTGQGWRELLEAAEEGLQALRGIEGPPAPRRAKLSVNGLPLRVAGTPVFVRLTNASGFSGAAEVTVRGLFSHDAFAYVLRLDVLLSTEVEGGVPLRRGGSFTSHIPQADLTPGRLLAEWFIFQEATRRKRKGSKGVGPAHFRFELFVPDEF